MSFKQGTVVAKKQGKDGRWILKFDRKQPVKENKTTSWYVYLMDGEVPPEVGSMWRKEEARLKQVDSLGGMDTYEVIPLPMKSDVRSFSVSENDEIKETKPPFEIRQELTRAQVAEMVCAASNVLAYSAISSQIDTPEDMRQSILDFTNIMFSVTDEIWNKSKGKPS